MRYAVLQKSLEVPAKDKLVRAFRSVSTLTTADAATAANDAYGILVKHQTHDDACMLQRALQVEGVETDVVLQDNLPRLPPLKYVRRADPLPEALLIYDPLGRQFPVQWDHVMLIAAGGVRSFELKQRREEPGTRNPRHELMTPDVLEASLKRLNSLAETTALHDFDVKIVIEIILIRCVLRYAIEAEGFSFQGLRERTTKDLLANSALFIQDIGRFAPRAVMNRGAFFLRSQPPELFSYPSKSAFQEETIWLMWQMSQAKDS